MESSDNPNHRFLSLTGVILELDYVRTTVHPQMEALKQRFFHPHPDEPVIFHRKEMVNRLAPFEALRDDALREAFDRELLQLLRDWEIVWCTEEIFDCTSGGVPHKHAVNRIIARR